MHNGVDFGEIKTNYEKFRPKYPDILFQNIFKHVSNIKKAALDIGAGTGLSTGYVAKEFIEVDIIEPDNRMTESGGFDSNVNIHNVFSEDFKFQNNHYQLVTAGNSFYWTNGEITAKSVYNSLEKKGVFAVFRYNFPVILDDELNRIVIYELNKKWNKYRSDRLIDENYSLRTISGINLFDKIECTKVKNIVKLTIDQIIGFLLSTSYCSQYVRENTTQEIYYDYLYNLMSANQSKEKYLVDFSLELIIAKKY